MLPPTSGYTFKRLISALFSKYPKLYTLMSVGQRYCNYEEIVFPLFYAINKINHILCRKSKLDQLSNAEVRIWIIYTSFDPPKPSYHSKHSVMENAFKIIKSETIKQVGLLAKVRCKRLDVTLQCTRLHIILQL